jgi:hypothetical protein
MQTTEGYFAELDAEKKRKMAEKGEYLCIVLQICICRRTKV